MTVTFQTSQRDLSTGFDFQFSNLLNKKISDNKSEIKWSYQITVENPANGPATYRSTKKNINIYVRMTRELPPPRSSKTQHYDEAIPAFDVFVTTFPEERTVDKEVTEYFENKTVKQECPSTGSFPLYKNIIINGTQIRG